MSEFVVPWTCNALPYLGILCNDTRISEAPVRICDTPYILICSSYGDSGIWLTGSAWVWGECLGGWFSRDTGEGTALISSLQLIANTKESTKHLHQAHATK